MRLQRLALRVLHATLAHPLFYFSFWRSAQISRPITSPQSAPRARTTHLVPLTGTCYFCAASPARGVRRRALPAPQISPGPSWRGVARRPPFPLPPPSSPPPPSQAVKAVNTVRVLGADIVERAASGHPGAPMGCAPMAHVLFSSVMKYNPAEPKWVRCMRKGEIGG